MDLLLSYLKSEPPMHLVLMCLEPVLAAFEFGHKDKHQGPLLHKAVSVLQFMTKMKKVLPLFLFFYLFFNCFYVKNDKLYIYAA